MRDARPYVAVLESGTKTPLGIALRGDVARLVVSGEQVGTLYRWDLHGVDGDWTAESSKYRLDVAVRGEVEVHFCLTAHGEAVLELVGVGQFFSPLDADGQVHRAPVLLKGEDLKCLTTPYE